AYLDQQHEERLAFLARQNEEQTAKKRAKRLKRKKGGGGTGKKETGAGDEGSEESGDERLTGAGDGHREEETSADAEKNEEEQGADVAPGASTQQPEPDSTRESHTLPLKLEMAPAPLLEAALMDVSSNGVGGQGAGKEPLQQEVPAKIGRFRPIKVVEDEAEW
ncbi:hypothetical protein HDU93_005388, partial [Gonapodya sp. JEL0774]